jgi:putative membrane protein
MNKMLILSFHYYIRSFIIFGISLYIAFLVKNQTLQYYIAPRMIEYVKWSSILLFLIASSQLYFVISTHWRNRTICDCEHPPSRSTIKNIATYSLLILPLLFGFSLPDTSMNSALAAKKGVILNTSNTTNQNYKSTEGEFIPANPYDMDYSKLSLKLSQQQTIQIKPQIFLESLTSIELFLDDFIAKKIEISGFIYRDHSMTDTQFVVTRFALQCCSADATPYGVMIENAHAKGYAEDTWVKITGTIQTTNYMGQKIMKVDATQIDKIQAPHSPYVYPNLEFLDEAL